MSPESIRQPPAAAFTVLGSTVLIVDAAPASQQALARMLAEAGHTVRTAAEGAEALRAAGLEPGAVPVDLVLLRRELPGMDGLQTLRLLRASERLRHVPVLLLDGEGGAGREARLAALRLGAEAVLSAPWDAEELLAHAGRCVEGKRRVDGLLARTQELQQLSTLDGLTQVHNHRHFQERLREEFRRAQRYGDPLSLILVDLDHFKAVNDAHGHLAGDGVLREVCAAMRQSVRDTDLLARCGGEEFAVLLPRTSVGGSLTVAERICRDLAALAIPLPQDAAPPGAGPLRVTASLGLAALPHRAITSAEGLFRAADEALYRAKREGRNRVCLATQVALLPDTASARAG